MADDNKDLLEDENKEEEKKSKKREPFFLSKMIEWILTNMIPVIVAVVLSTIIAVVLVRSTISRRQNEQRITVEVQPSPAPLDYFDLGEFRINTADINNSYFIRINISLGYDGNNKSLLNELVDRKTQIADIVLGSISSKEKADLDEAYEKTQLKEEIRRSINNVLNEGEIEAIYYGEFILS